MSTKGFFISYTKNDRTHAVTIRGWLEDAGFSVVMQDADFGVGSDFWRRGKSFFPPLSPVFIDFRDVGAALFEIKPSARSKKFAEHGHRVRLWRSRLSLRLLNGTADDFGLGNLPAGSQLPEPQSRDLVQSKSGSISHDRHTIVRTITLPGIKAGMTKEGASDASRSDRWLSLAI
jgi:hypothetical protein